MNFFTKSVDHHYREVKCQLTKGNLTVNSTKNSGHPRDPISDGRQLIAMLSESRTEIRSQISGNTPRRGYSISKLAVKWFSLVDSTTDLAERGAISPDSLESLLKETIETGTDLVRLGIRVGLDGHVEFKVGDIEATVANLETQLRCRFGPHNEPAVNARIAALFEESAAA